MSRRSANRIVVYTVIVCGRDELWEPALRPPGVDFVCFTDAPPRRDTAWDIRPAARTYYDPALTVRYHKLLPHTALPEYDVHVWLDGSLELTGDVREMVEAGGDLGLFPHRERQCAYEEAEVVVETRRGVPEQIREQVDRYSRAGLPPRFGLWEAGATVRRNTPRNRALNEAWWEEVQRHSRRDQLSLPFALWSLGLSWSSLQRNVADNPWLRLHDHPYLPHPRFFAEVYGDDPAGWPRHARCYHQAMGGVSL